MIRKVNYGLLVLLAWAPLMLAAGGHAHANGRTPSAHPQAASQTGHAAWGYGRGWCYWHPYACYRY